jgi:hypothetical protein
MTDRTKLAPAGSVVAIRAPATNELELGLVVSASPVEVDVIAVSEEARWATDADVLLPPAAIGFAAVVHRSIRSAVLPEQLDELVGAVDDPTGIADGTTKLDTGPPVLSDVDPRRLAHEELSERWGLWWEPVESLRATRTFGQLLARRRAIQGLTPAAVAGAADIPAETIAAVEREEPGVFGSLEPRALAGLLRQLAVIVGVEAAQRLRLAVLDSAGGLSPQPQVSFRAQSHRARSDHARRHADRYVAAVLQHLTG